VGALQATSLIVRMAVAAGVIGALLWFVVRPLWHAWQQQPDAERLMPKLPPPPEEELQIPVDPEHRPKPDRSEIIRQARADPMHTAMVLRQWIQEKKAQRSR